MEGIFKFTQTKTGIFLCTILPTGAWYISLLNIKSMGLSIAEINIIGISLLVVIPTFLCSRAWALGKVREIEGKISALDENMLKLSEKSNETIEKQFNSAINFTEQVMARLWVMEQIQLVRMKRVYGFNDTQTDDKAMYAEIVEVRDILRQHRAKHNLSLDFIEDELKNQYGTFYKP